MQPARMNKNRSFDLSGAFVFIDSNKKTYKFYDGTMVLRWHLNKMVTQSMLCTHEGI